MAIDLSNKEIKRGALQALNLILQSRYRKIKIEPDPDDPTNSKSKLKMPKNIDDTPPPPPPSLQDAAAEATRLKKIEQGLSDENLEQELKDIKADITFKDIASQQEQERIKGKQAELDKLRRTAKTGLADFSDFTMDLFKAIKSQLNTAKDPEDSYSRLNPTYAGSELLMPGQAYFDKKETPKIQVYFDQSGSWGSSEVDKGLSGLESLTTFERKGKIKILPPLYFSNKLHDNADDARAEKGTHGFPYVLQDIKSKLASGEVNNVIIMSDDDLDSQTNWPSCPKVEVRGCV